MSSQTVEITTADQAIDFLRRFSKNQQMLLRNKIPESEEIKFMAYLIFVFFPNTWSDYWLHEGGLTHQEIKELSNWMKGIGHLYSRRINPSVPRSMYVPK